MLTIDRSHCGQKVYGGCPGESCDRRCSAVLADEAARFNRSAPTRSELSKRHRTALYAFLVVLAAVFVGAITPQAVENIKAWEVANAPV